MKSGGAPRAVAVVGPPWRWSAATWRDRLTQYALLTRQHRPIGWLLLLWPTLWGLWLAARGVPRLSTLAIFVAGVVVMRSAGCAINDYADRWLDPQVSRTRDRPLAAGRVSPREALWVFAVLVLLAFGLVLLTNTVVIALSVAALVLAALYPFVKRKSYLPQMWLGAAFGMSVPMAWSAVSGDWPTTLAWLVFTANLLWTTAYDTWYAMVDRDDDIEAGARSSAILFGELDLVAIAVINAMFLAGMWLAGVRAELGTVYRIGWGLAAAMLAGQLWYARSREPERCFRAFLANNLVGLVLFAGIAADYAVSASRHP
jgi:4-hydroxybenzoate polyprenyltransferase